MSIFSGLFGGKEQRAFDSAAWESGFDGVGRNSSAGVTVTDNSSMNLNAVWACIRLYCNVVSSLPTGSYYNYNGARRPSYPEPAWLTKPNPEDRWTDFISKLVMSVLFGNAYVFAVRDKFGVAVELYVLAPHRVTPVRHPVTNKKVYVIDGDYKNYFEDTWDITHIRWMPKPDSLLGASPIEHAKDTIGLGLAIDAFGGKFFSNGATMSGVIETKENLTPEQVKALQAGFAAYHTGLQNAHRPGVLSAAQWRPLTIAPNEAQFLESRSYTASAIAGQVYGVPPHLIGETEKQTSFGSGVEQMFNGWLSTALGPLLVNIEAALSPLVDRNGFIKFNTDALLRTDAKTKISVQRLQVESGFLNIDEVRALNDLPPLPNGEGQTRFRPQTWIPLDAPAPNYFLPPEPAAPADDTTTDDKEKEN